MVVQSLEHPNPSLGDEELEGMNPLEKMVKKEKHTHGKKYATNYICGLFYKNILFVNDASNIIISDATIMGITYDCI